MSGPEPWLQALLVPLALAWTATLVRLAWARRFETRLTDVAPEAGAWPSLSVIVAARDEAAGIGAAVGSLLAQDYPGIEVVVVDDRSTDGTGAILDALAAGDPRLAVAHVETLPDGWLGKNHASHVGAGRARGEWLLFTDGDVVFAPDVLRRAVAFALSRRLGHLVVFPRILADGFWERAFVAAFGLLFALKTRVWELRLPGTRAFVGMGAFNLVRRTDYDRVGGHRALAFEVVDDLKLGLILRRSGVRQGAADSRGLVRVRWQHGLRASLAGLEKNAFAGLEWSWPALIVACLALALVALAPVAGVWLGTSPLTLGAAGLALGLPALVHAGIARDGVGGNGLEGLTFPVALLALVGVMAWSAARATIRGGIVWRGTRYPLGRLRAACVRERDWPHQAAVGWD